MHRLYDTYLAAYKAADAALDHAHENTPPDKLVDPAVVAARDAARANLQMVCPHLHIVRAGRLDRLENDYICECCNHRIAVLARSLVRDVPPCDLAVGDRVLCHGEGDDVFVVTELTVDNKWAWLDRDVPAGPAGWKDVASLRVWAGGSNA